jgi:hypothetical protein
MRLYLASCLTVLFAQVCTAQDKYEMVIRKKDDLFLKAQARPKVHLLGVFHFAGEKVDSNTTQFKWRYLSLEARRQREIEQVRQKLLAIKPTVICVEYPPGFQRQLDSAYEAYCKGQSLKMYGLEADGEIIQLAAETGKRLGLKRLVAVDARAAEALNDDKIYEEYLRFAPKEDSLFSYWDAKYYQKSKLEDSLRHYWSTLDFLRLLNSDGFNNKVLGRWLITTRHGTNINPVGADQFISRYFNRNVRIYSNIQRAITSDTDRVLVIYGNTHMSVLKQLFSSSPLYELVPAEKFLR